MSGAGGAVVIIMRRREAREAIERCLTQVIPRLTIREKELIRDYYLDED